MDRIWNAIAGPGLGDYLLSREFILPGLLLPVLVYVGRKTFEHLASLVSLRVRQRLAARDLARRERIAHMADQPEALAHGRYMANVTYTRSTRLVAASAVLYLVALYDANRMMAATMALLAVVAQVMALQVGAKAEDWHADVQQAWKKAQTPRERQAPV